MLRRLKPADCIYTVNGANTKTPGELNPYPQFNSNCLTPATPGHPSISVKYKLYQVAAVSNTARLYNLNRQALEQYVTSHPNLECSHLCRYPVRIHQILPGGLVNTVTTYEENKACFALNHLVLEPPEVNRSRIRCPGGEGCTHSPKCILVPTPPGVPDVNA